jgi:hypothetical protein
MLGHPQDFFFNLQDQMQNRLFFKEIVRKAAETTGGSTLGGLNSEFSVKS